MVCKEPLQFCITEEEKHLPQVNYVKALILFEGKHL